jgi:hypothetical protein
MSDIVWASNAMINPAMLRPLSHSFGDERLDFTAKCQRDNNAGKLMGPECFPPEIFVAKDADRNYEKLPELFFGFGYWVVSGEVADVMRRFDLGQGDLYPTKVFRKDRVTPIGDKWFCLNFGNVKQAFLPEQSTFRPLGPSKTFWMPNATMNDKSIAVTGAALDGPDIWLDAIVGDVFFLSDPLATALKAAGVARAFGLKKCRVI